MNYFSSQILPYYLDGNNLRILFERKSDCYVPPFFNNSLGLLGGNDERDGREKCFRDILERELNEEFFVVDEK